MTCSNSIISSRKSICWYFRLKIDLFFRQLTFVCKSFEFKIAPWNYLWLRHVFSSLTYISVAIFIPHFTFMFTFGITWLISRPFWLDFNRFPTFSIEIFKISQNFHENGFNFTKSINFLPIFSRTPMKAKWAHRIKWKKRRKRKNSYWCKAIYCWTSVALPRLNHLH